MDYNEYDQDHRACNDHSHGRLLESQNNRIRELEDERDANKRAWKWWQDLAVKVVCQRDEAVQLLRAQYGLNSDAHAFLDRIGAKP